MLLDAQEFVMVEKQVIEAIAVFASHGNSGGSAPWEIDFVKRLCNWDIISPLRFTDDEWSQISSDGIRLEDVTEELEDKAYEEMRHN